MADNGRAVLMVIPVEGFREEEYKAAREALEKSGVKVVTASTVRQGALGYKGTTVDPEVLIDEVNPDDYAGVVFIGGHGASQYWHDYKAHEIIRTHAKAGKLIAANDRAPVALAVAGILAGKNVTGHNSIFEKLSNAGAKYTGRKVERDGNVITGEGPNAISLYANELAKAVQGKA
ncbi:MAG: DJ-1/PfpI family protein [candidate division KSB1 bacterium]|nr:DJ-1/PfpI family protein [candidate division KSB1 bacterium]MDZ7365181.1 DJ-1/PfpI family protein [candidate division KSB1 bacterium]MDZ7404391.1 DJ-1/PfpI family protein [candidate division KSB1 bacterium]